jgi:very-short-patch-repair endonuclease
MASKLLIELDGSQHGGAAIAVRDQARTRWLEAEGYRVIRFWNNDVTTNLDGVLDTIHAALYGSRDGEPRRLIHERGRASSPHPGARCAPTLPLRGG